MSIWPLFLILTVAMWIYISLWFALGQYFKRLDILDSAWGLSFAYIALLTLLITMNYEPIPVMSTVLVGAWGVRLFVHISSRNIKKDEDSRYSSYRQKWKNNFAANAYFRLYLSQAALALAISTASVGAITSESFVGPIAYAGLTIWLLGIVFEAVADWQLRQFIAQRTSRKEVMDKGLWRYSRHPNYFGEIIVWVGAGLVAVAGGAWWGIIGPITITFLLTKVSGVPLLEKKYAGNPEYEIYKKKTSILIPLPPRG